MNLENSLKNPLWDNVAKFLALVGVGICGWQCWQMAPLPDHAIVVKGWFSPRPSVDISLTPSLLALCVTCLSCVLVWRGAAFRKWGLGLVFATAVVATLSPSETAPPKAKSFLELTALQGNLWTPPNWQKAISTIPGVTVVSASHSDIRWLPLAEASQVMSSGEWILVFENNVSLIALRKTDRNAANFSRVMSYYQRHQLPWDPQRGVNVAWVYQIKPSWIVAMEEKTVKTWLTRDPQILDAITDANYYLSRSIFQRAKERLEEALEIFPKNPYLMVRLSQIFLDQKNYPVASQWLRDLDTNSLPEELVTTVQRMRFSLRTADSPSNGARLID